MTQPEIETIIPDLVPRAQPMYNLTGANWRWWKSSISTKE